MKRLFSIISVLFICALFAGSLSAAAPVPVIGPNGQPALTPTFDSPIACHQSIPKGAILGTHVTYPDPATCNEPLSSVNAPKNLASIYPKESAKQFADFDSRMANKFNKNSITTASSYSYDDYWGWWYGLNQVLKAGILAQVSAVVPTYNVGTRPVKFQNAFKPAQYSCLAAGVEHVRNDVPGGNWDYFVWWDACANGSIVYVWSFADPNVQAAYVRNDVFGSPFMYMGVEQTSQVGTCFSGEAFNYSTGVWVTVYNKCGTGTTQGGYFFENAFNLNSPTAICPPALNPYMYQVYKKVGVNWTEITASELSPQASGLCTQGNPPSYYAEYLTLQGHSTLIFHQN